jgi:hypothetical protein
MPIFHEIKSFSYLSSENPPMTVDKACILCYQYIMAQPNDLTKDGFDEFDTEETLPNPAETENPTTDDKIDALTNQIHDLVAGMTRVLENPARNIVPKDSPYKEQLEVMQAMQKISSQNAEVIIKSIEAGAKHGANLEKARGEAERAKLEAKIDLLQDALDDGSGKKNPVVEALEILNPVLREAANIVSDKLQGPNAPAPAGRVPADSDNSDE